MYQNNMIQTQQNSQCQNGMTAMIEAQKVYESGCQVNDSHVMKDIAKYNEFDCRVIKDILNFIRKE